MSEDFIVKSTKKSYAPSSVVSARLSNDLIKQLDDISDKTGRSRNELIGMCVEYALSRIQIEDAD